MNKIIIMSPGRPLERYTLQAIVYNILLLVITSVLYG